MDYRRSRSSDDEGLKDSHNTGKGEEVSPNTAIYKKGKRCPIIQIRARASGGSPYRS